ncbi:MAG: acetyl-coenzyme A synthetase N-terminal domain-containing protein [Paludibaculum sp.]
MEAYQELYRRAEADPEGFWAERAESEVSWFEKWSHVYEWHPPFVKWFVGAKTNAAYNCLDRRLETRGDKPAILFEGEPGDQRTLTYRELHEAVGAVLRTS